MRRARALTGAGALGGALVASLLLTGCGKDAGGAEPGPGTSGTAVTATPSGTVGTGPPAGTPAPVPSGSTPPGTLPTAYTFTPDPARVPHTAEEARRFTRAAALDPDSWSAGMVRHDPYEGGGDRPVLSADCAWSRGPLPADVLDSHTRRIDMPAKDGKGRVLGSVTLTVHRDVAAADRDMRDTVQQSFRCPDQDLGGGQFLRGLMSMHQPKESVLNADASMFESGKFIPAEAGGPGAPQGYVWTKSRIGSVVMALSVKGAQGYETRDLLLLAAEGGAKALYRVELELK
ncbi:hypothetical protein ACWGHM_03645 [Streptomyces sp. NPDC054904]|uniref:hypothetical protein n=1 Tax=Streptomyces sp. NPDC090054 TaxID=3365933 RepID=UPI00381CCA88